MRTPNSLIWVWIGLITAGLVLLVFSSNKVGNEEQNREPKGPPKKEAQKRPEKPAPKGSKTEATEPVENRESQEPEKSETVSGPDVGAGEKVVEPEPRVVDPAGRPVPGAGVSLVLKGENRTVSLYGVWAKLPAERVIWETKTAQDDGSFQWPEDLAALLPGDNVSASRELVFEIAAEGFQTYTRAASTDHLPPGKVELSKGTKLFARGFKKKDAGSPVLLVRAGDMVVSEVKQTGPRGQAEFPNVKTGSYFLFVGDPEISAVQSVPDALSEPDPRYCQPVEVTGDSKEVNVDMSGVLSKFAELRGAANGACGQEIVLRSGTQNNPLRRVHTVKPDGTFSFRFVPPGTYRLILVPNLGKVHTLEGIVLEEGEIRDKEIGESEFNLVEIKGRIKKAAEVPVEVTLSMPEAGEGLTAVPDAKGEFSFKGLRPGGYRLKVTGRGEKSEATAVEKFVYAPDEIEVNYPPVKQSEASAGKGGQSSGGVEKAAKPNQPLVPSKGPEE